MVKGWSHDRITHNPSLVGKRLNGIVDINGKRVSNIDLLTCNTHTITEIYRVPNHRPVGYGDQGLGVLIWVGSEGRER